MARECGYDDIVAIIEEEERRRAKLAARNATDPAPHPQDEPARTAVAEADFEWLRARLAEGKLTNHVHWSEGGLPTIAVRNNRSDVLEFLLDCGFDPDERVSSGEGDWIAIRRGIHCGMPRPWGNATWRSYYSIAALFDRRDDPLRSTPLGWACRWARIRLMKLLFEHGADPEESDAERWARPRSWTQKMGHFQILQSLGRK